MERDELLQSILHSESNADYPPEFLAKYDIMECLSEQKGISTFLVQDHEENRFVAKCFEKALWMVTGHNKLLGDLDYKTIPKQTEVFENDKTLITVREYIEGIPLSRYAQENELSEKEVIRICVELCDTLYYLHHREEPVIHRDVKPQNIIVCPDGSISLIDFDIARVYRSGHDTDTVFFGTRAYAPPEQYGFSQTDARTDIYSLGVLLRWLLTGSTKENKNIRIYRPLAKVIRKCTGFAPKERYADISQVKKALLAANPRSQRLRIAAVLLCAGLGIGLLAYGGYRLYKYITETSHSQNGIRTLKTQ